MRAEEDQVFYFRFPDPANGVAGAIHKALQLFQCTVVTNITLLFFLQFLISTIIICHPNQTLYDFKINILSRGKL